MTAIGKLEPSAMFRRFSGSIAEQPNGIGGSGTRVAKGRPPVLRHRFPWLRLVSDVLAHPDAGRVALRSQIKEAPTTQPEPRSCACEADDPFAATAAMAIVAECRNAGAVIMTRQRCGDGPARIFDVTAGRWSAIEGDVRCA